MRRALPALAFVLVVAALAALPFVTGAHGQQLGYRILQLLVLAAAWNLLAGYGGLVSLGTAAFVGLGAYALTEASNRTGLPPLLVLPLSGLAAAAFAAAVSPAMFRLRGLYFTVGSLALAEGLRLLMVNLPTFGGASGLILQATSPPTYQLYWIQLGVAALALACVYGLLASPFSLSLQALRDDEDVAREVGVPTFQVKLAVFTLSAGLMGLAGGVQALKLGAVEPYGAFGGSWTIDTLAAAIIGGLGGRFGPLLGAVFYVALAEALKGFPELHAAMAGVVLLLVVRFAPNGLWGALMALRRRTRGKVAEAVADG